MFKSIASFIFGSNETTNSEVNQNPKNKEQEQQQYDRPPRPNRIKIDTENTIQVTSSTPSVTGTSTNNVAFQNKRGKNRRNRQKRNALIQQQPSKPTQSISKLLTSSESFDEDFDDSDWYIVDREEDEEGSLPRTDSDEEEGKPHLTSSLNAVQQQRQRRQHQQQQQQLQQQQQHQQHINLHSYKGPRPHQQRNYLQRSRISGSRSGGGDIVNFSSLSPHRSYAGGNTSNSIYASADGGVTQPLYAVPHNSNDAHNSSGSECNVPMDGSWFITPPPCFTSTGPINMVTSPYENLLIEHPSMSVYRSIRSAQEAANSSYIDLEAKDISPTPSATSIVEEAIEMEQEEVQNDYDERAPRTVAVHQRSARARIDTYSAAQLKQQLFERNGQKNYEQKAREQLRRGAIWRANKTRDFQSKANRQRRADMQHFRVVSGANNNRKCYF